MDSDIQLALELLSKKINEKALNKFDASEEVAFKISAVICDAINETAQEIRSQNHR